jgi:hypothetical protein
MRPQSLALLASTLKLWIVAQYRVTALLADKPAWSLDHRLEIIVEDAIRATHNLGP